MVLEYNFTTLPLGGVGPGLFTFKAERGGRAGIFGPKPPRPEERGEDTDFEEEGDRGVERESVGSEYPRVVECTCGVCVG